MKERLILALYICLAVSFTACSQSGDAKEPVMSQSQSVDEGSIASEREEYNSPTFVEDNAFYQDILLSYGGEIITVVNEGNRQYLSAPMTSPFFASDWETFGEFSVASLCTWYYVGEEEATKNGFIPDDFLELGIYPQELFEPFVQEHFNLTKEQLRSGSDIYDAEHKGYRIGWGGAMGNAPEIKITNIEKDGNIRKLHLFIDERFDIDQNTIQPENKILTVNLDKSGGYTFESYTTIK